MKKLLNILALVLVLTGCQVIPCQDEFYRAHFYPGDCTDKVEFYAMNTWAAGYNPRKVIVDKGYPELHMVLLLESRPGQYFDPTAARVWNNRTVGNIKMIYPKFNPEKEATNGK